MTKRDGKTLDLFGWESPRMVSRFEEKAVSTASFRARIALAVAATLKDAKLPRETIAERMTQWLGEKVTKHILDAYASAAREEHTIPYLKLLALIHVTNDARLLQLGAEMFGHSVVEDRWLPWVEVGQLADRKEDIDKAFDTARRTARKGARP